jgi:hypothetical protein
MARLLQRVRRYLALPQADRRLFIRAFIGLVLVDLKLRTSGSQRLISPAELAEQRPPRQSSTEFLQQAECYARWLEIAARHHVVRAQCLHRSLVLHRWLRREGLPSELRIGVRKEDGALKAHAWVELGGEVVREGRNAVAAFTPLANTIAGRSGWSSGIAAAPVKIDLGKATWQ